MTTKFKAWLWPDRVIGKSASRTYREEYNKLYNAFNESMDALERISKGNNVAEMQAHAKNTIEMFKTA